MNSNPNFASEFQTIPLQTQQNKMIFPKANPSINNSLLNDIEEFSSNDGRRDEGGRRREEEGRKRKVENIKKEESIIYRREEEEKRREDVNWKWDDENRRREEEIPMRVEEERKSLKKPIFGDMKEGKILTEQFSNSILESDVRLSVKRENSNTIRSDFEVLQRKYPNTGINRRNIENINLTFCLECQNFLEIDNTNLHILFCRKKSTKNALKPKNRIFNSQISASKENRENLLKKLDNLDKLIFTKPSYSHLQLSSQPSPQPSSQPSSQSISKISSKPPINNASSSLLLPDREYLKVLEVILIGILESIRVSGGGSSETVEDLDRLKNCYLTQEKGVGQRYLLVISRVKEIVEGYLKGKEEEWVGAA